MKRDLTIALAVLIGIVLVVLAMRGARGQQADFDNWLVLIVDVSGSVSTEEYGVQRDGYVEVLLDPMIAKALDRTAVAIVEFGSTAVVSVAWTDVRGAGAAYRERKRPFAGNTCVYCGIELALQLLDGKTGKRVIDISGDGVENVKHDGTKAVHALRDLATMEGIELNTLALLVEPNNTYLGGGYHGRGGEQTALQKWYADLANGFAMHISSLEDIAHALRRKLFVEIAGLEIEP